MVFCLNNRGQGTIEYLVILAVVVVIGLVVVSLSTSFFDSAGNISTTTRDISRVTTSGIVVTEGVVDSDGNILLNLRNQTGQVLTLTGVDADGTSSSYENRLTTNQEILLKAVSENCKCAPGQTTTTCEVQFTYDTQIPNRTDPKILIELECQEQITTTTPPITPLFAGLCGEAVNQEPVYETPSNNLCETGDSSTITYNIEDGNWEWTCTGSTQALSTNCSAQRDTGDGTPETPKVLFTCQDLQDMNQNLSGHYILGQNIDCSETTNWNFNGEHYEGFHPIGGYGNEVPNGFIGSLNGNGKKIYNLYINNNNTKIGLFSQTYTADIKNIGLIDLNYITESSDTSLVGGLIGLKKSGSVSETFVTGNIRNNSDTQNYSKYTGGLIGLGNYSTLISNSYSKVNVIGNHIIFSQAIRFISGLIGGQGMGGIVNNSYSTGLVEKTNYGQTHGLSSGQTVNNSYWDINTSNQETSNQGTPKTTEQMTYNYNEENTFSAWDFEEIWAHDIDGTINDGYPYLRWQTE